MDTEITFWIAVASFLMSLASWVKDAVTQRMRLESHIVLCHTAPNSPAAYLYLVVANKSRLPLTITDIALVIGGKEVHCVSRSKLVSTKSLHRGKEIIEQTSEYSTPLPIQIMGLGGSTVLSLFENLPEKIPPDASSLNFSIYTNRGRPKKMTLELPVGWADQKIL